MDKHRIALFAAEFLPYSETFIYDEVRNHRRYHVDVFTARRKFADRFPYPHVTTGGLSYEILRWSPGFDRAFTARRYALIHAHFGPTAVQAMSYARRFGLPLVVTFHGHDVPVLGSFERYRPRYIRYALHARRMLAHMFLGLCASSELAELLMELGVPAERLRVHRLGVDLERFRMSDRTSRSNDTAEVLMIGRFVAKKGFGYGIRAFARALGSPGSGRRAHLTIIGGGPLELTLRELVARLGIMAQVTFAGVLPPERVAEHLRRSHVLLAPSVVAMGGDRESGVIAIKEACASGVVPVGTYHGGIPEIIDDHVTGFLVVERDVDGLADRLGRLLDDRELCRDMALAGRKKMEREYDVRRQVDALESIYDHVQAGRRPLEHAAGNLAMGSASAPPRARGGA